MLQPLVNLLLLLLAWLRRLLYALGIATVVVAPVAIVSVGVSTASTVPDGPSLPLPSAAIPLALGLGAYALHRRRLP